MKQLDMKQKTAASPIVMGCMRIAGLDKEQLRTLVGTAMELGINTFDHADIYGGGESERLFGKVLRDNPALREEMFLQSKCGIRNGCYDFSKEHILRSVDGILQRLSTDYLNLLILHRPDLLMDAEEVAEAFESLRKAGKVLGFGVSNMNPMQIELLQKYTDAPILVNQLQLSIAHTNMLDEGIHVNMRDGQAPMTTGSVLDYCRLKGIGIQSWSSLQYGFFEGTFVGSEQYQELNALLEELAGQYGASPAAVAIAWILRIPGVSQAVIGTTKTERVRELAAAGEISLSREEWYRLYLACGNRLP